MSTFKQRTVRVVCGLVCLLGSAVHGQGPLNPPGPPAPTMKTLEQIEPRRPISSLPFTINQPGSYYVTTNLTGDFGGISIVASDVTLDLMGFELVGGSGQGLAASAVTNVVIRNGMIRGWSSHGISMNSAHGVRLEHIESVGNGVHGVWLGAHSAIRQSASRDNGSVGIFVGDASLMENCTAWNNGTYGFRMSSNGVLRECAATQNTQAGVSVAGTGNRIEANHVSGSLRGFDIIGVSNLVVRNSTKSSAIPYDIAAGNSVGGIVNVSGAGFTNANPWVNFSF